MKIDLYLAGQIEAALKKAYDTETRVIIEKPRQETWGDFATTVALGLAKTLRQAPRNIAETLVDNFTDDKELVKKITVDGPGFINFILKKSYWQNTIAEIITAGENMAMTTGAGAKESISNLSVPTPPGR